MLEAEGGIQQAWEMLTKFEKCSVVDVHANARVICGIGHGLKPAEYVLGLDRARKIIPVDVAQQLFHLAALQDPRMVLVVPVEPAGSEGWGE